MKKLFQKSLNSTRKVISVMRDMMNNGQYKFAITSRELEDNKQFCNLLQSASENLSAAVKDITSKDVPNLNSMLTKELLAMYAKLVRINNYVKAGRMPIYEVAEVEEQKLYYYEFKFFYNRENNGVIYLKVPLNRDNFANDDEFLEELVNKRVINLAVANSIMEINAVDESVYKEKHAAYEN